MRYLVLLLLTAITTLAQFPAPATNVVTLTDQTKLTWAVHPDPNVIGYEATLTLPSSVKIKKELIGRTNNVILLTSFTNALPEGRYIADLVAVNNAGLRSASALLSTNAARIPAAVQSFRFEGTFTGIITPIP